MKRFLIVLLFIVFQPLCVYSEDVLLNQKYQIKYIDIKGSTIPLIILLDIETGRTWQLNINYDDKSNTMSLQKWYPIFVETLFPPGEKETILSTSPERAIQFIDASEKTTADAYIKKMKNEQLGTTP